LPAGTGLVRDNKGKINCGTLCLGTSASYPSGTTVVLTAKADILSSFANWGGACSGGGSTCTVVMDSDKSVTASFSLLSLLTAEPPAAARSLEWTIQLDVPGAVGQIVLNGQAVRAARGQSQAAAAAREGDNVIEAQLVEARDRPGTWRFEAQEGETIAPGSLRVLRGDVALLTPTAVVFRLKGVSGEQVAFSYRLRR
jgi:List-Bact-rpt repeat protein